MFYAYHYEAPATVTYKINGHAHTAAWPYSSQGFTSRTLAFDVPLSDLVVGPQQVVIFADRTMVIANVNVVLVNVGSASATATPTSAASPTLTPTVVIATATAVPTPTSEPTAVPTPTAGPVCRAAYFLNGTLQMGNVIACP